ncbi:hypothetical protein ABES33_25020 [Bacillus pseudomycoides]|uniref:hypothetical protein n=1 Tax=Bacillus pseudomycoides TaxID=64104 RepID=UPI003D23D498
MSSKPCAVSITPDPQLNRSVAVTAGDFIIDIDVLFVELILELNKKGYKTSNCCQGHPTGDEYCNSYIGVPPHRYQAKKYKYPKTRKLASPGENVQFFVLGVAFKKV